MSHNGSLVSGITTDLYRHNLGSGAECGRAVRALGLVTALGAVCLRTHVPGRQQEAPWEAAACWGQEGPSRLLVTPRSPPPPRLLTAPCHHLLLTADSESHLQETLPPLPTPVTHLTLILVSNVSLTQVAEELFYNRKLIIVPLDGEDVVYWKTEFDNQLQESPLEGFRMKEASLEDIRKREVLVSTFNCTVNSVIGPIDANGKPEWYDGFEMNTFSELARALGLPWRLIETRGYSDLVNGSWTPRGLKSNLFEGLADVGFCELWVTNYLYNDVDIVPPRQTTCTRFMVPRPIPISINWLGIFNTLPPEYWIVTLALSLFCGFSLRLLGALVVRFTPYLPQGSPEWTRCMLEVLCLLWQGGPTTSLLTSSASLSTVVTALSLFSLLSATLYSSNLVSQLAQPTYSPKLETIEELVQAGYTWSFDHVIENPEMVFTKMDEWEQKWLTRFSMDLDLDDRARKMRGRKFALLGESIGADLFYIAATHKPEAGLLDTYTASSQCVSGNLMTIMLRKGSSYTRLLEQVSGRLNCAGLGEQLLRDTVASERVRAFVAPTAFRDTRGPGGQSPLSLPVLRLPFLILCGGLLASSASFIAETLLPYRNHQEDVHHDHSVSPTHRGATT